MNWGEMGFATSKREATIGEACQALNSTEDSQCFIIRLSKLVLKTPL
jgi:hypothetical protein